MKQFDIVRYGATLGVIIDCDLLPRDRSVVVIPLLEGLLRAGKLNPVIEVGQTPYVLATRLIMSVRCEELIESDISVKNARDAITRAIDVLLGGI